MPFRAEPSELLVLAVLPIGQFLAVPELLVNREGTYWDTVVPRDLLQSETVSVRDLEHSA